MSVTRYASYAELAVVPNCARHRVSVATGERPLSIRALVVSGIRLYRDAIQQSLSVDPKINVVGVSGVDEAVDQIRRLSPDVVVLDATGPGGASFARSLKALDPSPSVVVVTSAREEAEFLTWAEAGVSGYADQNSSAADLAAAIQHAARGEVVCSPRLAGLLAGRIAKLSAERQRATELTILTARERDVMALVSQGLSNKQVAKRLGISDTTTKNHVHNILDKLGVQSRGQAAAQYLQVCGHPQS